MTDGDRDTSVSTRSTSRVSRDEILHELVNGLTECVSSLEKSRVLMALRLAHLEKDRDLIITHIEGMEASLRQLRIVISVVMGVVVVGVVLLAYLALVVSQ